MQSERAELERLVEAWDGERVVLDQEPTTGAWIFICMHSFRLGPAGGGTRMKVYRTPEEGLRDGFRLASAMTQKMAVSGMPFGGGKGVLAVPQMPDAEGRRAIIRRYGELIGSLGGQFVTGPDMNTSEIDMDLIYSVAPYAFGRSTSRGGMGNPAPSTARGVFYGIREGCAHLFGSSGLEGRRVLVQGVGSVGTVLVELLRSAGAEVLVSDVDQSRVAPMRARGATAVSPEKVETADCDIFSPCAVGGILNSSSIPRLRYRIVAGAANNQLETPQDAGRLRQSQILYAPDFVINAGGVLHLIGGEMLGWSGAELEGRLQGIGSTLRDIFGRAQAEGITTEEAAERIARARLDRGPQ